jgi:hypothetical protein
LTCRGVSSGRRDVTELRFDDIVCRLPIFRKGLGRVGARLLGPDPFVIPDPFVENDPDRVAEVP